MADALQYIENLNPNPPNFGNHASRVAAFRTQVSRHVMLKKTEPFNFYIKALLSHFNKGEIEWLVEFFSGFAPAEIVAGKSLHNRLLSMHAYGSAGGDEVRKYFLTSSEQRSYQALCDSAKQRPGPKVGIPTPVSIVAGKPHYQTEGPRDRMIRRLAQGKYLFGDLGGLTGGFAFVVSKDLVGNDFDNAVAHGAIVAAVTGLAGEHYKAKADARIRWRTNPKSGMTAQRHVGRPSAKVDPIRIIPALPSPVVMGSNPTASMLQLLKTLNRAGAGK